MLEHNADVDLGSADGSPPIRIAAEGNHVGVMRVLLAHNADPNIPSHHDGTTPLRMAAKAGHVDAVKALLDSKADPNVGTTVERITPLYNAAAEGHTEVVRLLLNRSADSIQTRTNEGFMPMTIAAWLDRTDVVQLLVFHVPFPLVIAIPDDRGEIAAGYAKQGNPKGRLAEWLTAAAGWSKLRVAADCRMHKDLAGLLRQGRIDPDDRAFFPVDEIVAAIAASKSESYGFLPSEDKVRGASTICRATIQLVTDASFGWKYSSHWLYHANVRDSVVAVLMVAHRLKKNEEMLRAAEATTDALAEATPGGAAAGGGGGGGGSLSSGIAALFGGGGGSSSSGENDARAPAAPGAHRSIWDQILGFHAGADAAAKEEQRQKKEREASRWLNKDIVPYGGTLDSSGSSEDEALPTSLDSRDLRARGIPEESARIAADLKRLEEAVLLWGQRMEAAHNIIGRAVATHNDAELAVDRQKAALAAGVGSESSVETAEAVQVQLAAALEIATVYGRKIRAVEAAKKAALEEARNARAAVDASADSAVERDLSTCLWGLVGLGGPVASIAEPSSAPADNVPLPLLPPELWLLVIHFFQRSWWPSQ